jgi:MFS family permease
MKNPLESNLWKYFIYSATQRRHYIVILSIFFLTLPNTHAQQIGLYSGIGTLMSFLLEIPSGYISDIFGHRRTLIMSKIFMLFSTTIFAFANSLVYFIFGSIFLSLGFAFSSGTTSAFMHETLTAINRDKEFTKIMSKISANVSLIGVFLIIGLPFLTRISIVAPIKVSILFDIVGLIVAISFISPPKRETVSNPLEVLPKLLKNVVGTGFYPTAIFVGAIFGIFLGTSPYRSVYLESLGFPIVFIGLVAGLSRLIWFLLGQKMHLLEEKFGMKKILRFEMFFFPVILILVVLPLHYYIIGAIFTLAMGYFWSRVQLINNHFLTAFNIDPKYKATMLSVRSQVQLVFSFATVFLIGFVMKKSYLQGYLILGVCMFFILLGVLIYVKFTSEKI